MGIMEYSSIMGNVGFLSSTVPPEHPTFKEANAHIK